MTLKRTAARSMMWLAAEGGVSTLLSVASLFVMARIVGPAEFGLAALALGVLMMLNQFVEFLFQDALVQREDVTPEHEATAQTAAVAIGVGLFALCIALAWPLAALFREPRFAWVFIVGATALLATGFLAVPTARLRRSFDFRALTLRTIVSRTLGALLGPALAFAGFEVWCFIAQHLAAALVSVVLIRRAAPQPVGWRLDWRRLREMAGFGMPVILMSLAQMMQLRVFTLLVGYFLDVRAAGFVNMSFRLVDTFRELISDGLYRIGLSVFARQQADPAALRQSYAENLAMMCLLAHPVFAGLFVVAPDLIPLMLGSAWVAIVPLVQVLSLFAIFYFTVFQSEVLAVALGRPALPAKFFGASMAVVLAVMLALRPREEVLAIAAWIAPIVLLAPVWLVAMARLTGWPAWSLVAPGVRSLAAAGVMIAGLIALGHWVLPGFAGWARLGAKVGAGVALYGLASLALNRSTLVGFVHVLR